MHNNAHRPCEQRIYIYHLYPVPASLFSPGYHVYFANCYLSVGVLACLDGYMNIAMEQTEEYVDGQLKSKYGDCFIRGNNGM